MQVQSVRGEAMLAKQISVQKTEVNLDQLLSLVREGAEITIMQGEESIAKIVSADASPLQPIRERVFGAHPGAWMSEDFDAPLGDEFWLGKDA
jgi:antitoxin (DNA-binding transcriptional repressor) of toxin-antitoxin stability system